MIGVNDLLSSSTTDPLVHYGRHFGHTVHALCNTHALLTNGILRMADLADGSGEYDLTAELAISFSKTSGSRTYFWRHREAREHKIFLTLLQSFSGLEERLLTGSDEELGIVAELVCPAS